MAHLLGDRGAQVLPDHGQVAAEHQGGQVQQVHHAGEHRPEGVAGRLDRLHRDRVAVLHPAEQAVDGRTGRQAGRVQQAVPADVLLEAAVRPAAARRAGRVDGHVADLAGPAVGAEELPAVQPDRRADADVAVQVDEARPRPGPARAGLGDGTGREVGGVADAEVDVGADDRREQGVGVEVGPAEVRGDQQPPVAPVHQPGQRQRRPRQHQAGGQVVEDLTDHHAQVAQHLARLRPGQLTLVEALGQHPAGQVDQPGGERPDADLHPEPDVGVAGRDQRHRRAPPGGGVDRRERLDDPALDQGVDQPRGGRPGHPRLLGEAGPGDRLPVLAVGEHVPGDQFQIGLPQGPLPHPPVHTVPLPGHGQARSMRIVTPSPRSRIQPG